MFNVWLLCTDARKKQLGTDGIINKSSAKVCRIHRNSTIVLFHLNRGNNWTRRSATKAVSTHRVEAHLHQRELCRTVRPQSTVCKNFQYHSLRCYSLCWICGLYKNCVHNFHSCELMDAPELFRTHACALRSMLNRFVHVCSYCGM